MQPLVLLLLLAGAANAVYLGCNPSNHCDPNSMECYSCNPYDEYCDVNLERLGECTDTHRIKCTNGVCEEKPYPAKRLRSRCMEIIESNKPNRRGKKWNTYVKACREGEYTCDDGTCEPRASLCKKNGGVRYGKDRCVMTQSSLCGDKLETCSFDDDSNNPLLAASYEGCTSDCNTDEYEANLPSCCTPVTATEASCRYIDIVGGNTVIMDPDGHERGGMSFTFQFEEPTQSCCCESRCSCFGDPHCTTFFGEHQTTTVEQGSILLYQEGDFRVEGFLSAPGGVFNKVHFTVSDNPGHTYLLSALDCQNGTHNIRSLDSNAFIMAADLPASWDIFPTPDQNPTRFQSSSWTTPSRYLIRDQKSSVQLSFVCRTFYFGDSQITKTRIDPVLIKSYSLDDETGCCPTHESSFAQMQTTSSSGFCMNNEPLPGTQNIARDGDRRRRLGEQPPKELQSTYARLLTGDLSHDDVDPQIVEACSKFLEVIQQEAGKAYQEVETMEQCIQNVQDFGIQGILGVIESLTEDTSEMGSGSRCIADINDIRLINANVNECEQHFVMQLKPKDGSSGWEDFRKFPANYYYCNNTVTMLFRNTLWHGEPLDIDAVDLRIKQCNPDPTICGYCDSTHGLKGFSSEFLFECTVTPTVFENAVQMVQDALVTGQLQCGEHVKSTTMAGVELACKQEEVVP